MSLQLHRPDGKGGLEVRPVTDDNWRKIFDPSMLEPTTPATAPHDPEQKSSAPPAPSADDSQSPAE